MSTSNLMDRVQQHGEYIADHSARIKTNEDAVKEINGKLNWILGLVITTLLGVLVKILIKG